MKLIGSYRKSCAAPSVFDFSAPAFASAALAAPAALAAACTRFFWVGYFRGDFLAALGCGLFCGFALLGAWRLGLVRERSAALLFAAAALAAGLIRVLLFPYVSNDYTIAYKLWMEAFREAGGLPGLAQNIGDYNYPYRYFLALFAYLPGYDLYLIKLLSIAFDLVLAYFAARLTGRFTDKASHIAAAYLITLFLPTVVLNGAKWAQCDSIYSAFMLGAVLYGLERKPVRSVVFGALAFAFKLQAVFLLPIFAVLWMGGRVKLKHLLLFPAVYLAAMLPALIAGHSLYDVFFVYFNQTGMFSSYLTLNAPSIFMLVGDLFENTSLGLKIGTLAGFAYLAALLTHALVHRRRISDRAVMRYALAMCVGIPFLLPSMHERYFYMAETISVAMACAGICGELLPILIQLPPLLCYDAYFRGHYRVYPEFIGTVMLGCAVITSASAFCSLPRLRLSLETEAEPEPEPESESEPEPDAQSETKPEPESDAQAEATDDNKPESKGENDQ